MNILLQQFSDEFNTSHYEKTLGNHSRCLSLEKKLLNINKRCSPQSFRRTYATHQLKAGMSLQLAGWEV